VRLAARLLTATAAAGLLLVAGFAGVAHASGCGSRAVRHLSWTRSPGARAGVLHWKSPKRLPVEAGYRVWRSGALIGVARRHRAAIRVTPRHTYTFTVRVENLVTGHVSVCSASFKRTISYYPPGKAKKLVVTHVRSSSVHLAWRRATAGDGRMAGYRVYRNGEVVRQTESIRLTAQHLFAGKEYSFYVRAVDTNGVQGPRSRIENITTPEPERTTGNATAFVLESDGASFADLQRNYLHVGTILPTYFNCTPAGGSMGVDDPLVTSWALRRGLRVEPRFNCQNMAALKAILTNSAVQQHLIAQLVNLTLKYGYQGINIDFESNDASAYRAALSNFATNFATALHAHSKKLSMEVSAAYYNQLVGRAGFYDYRALSAVADQVIVMAWGKAWAVSPPGGLDQMPWFRTVLAYVHTMPLRSKFTIAMTLYGFDWPSGGGPAHAGTPLEWRNVRALIGRYHVQPVLDPTADDPHFSYVDSAGTHHDVWYSNRRTIADRVALARSLGLGVAFWRLGREDPDIWGTRLIGG
jgi:spore germination protein YaaH